jgi:hypothetical protein
LILEALGRGSYEAFVDWVDVVWVPAIDARSANGGAEGSSDQVGAVLDRLSNGASDDDFQERRWVYLLHYWMWFEGLLCWDFLFSMSQEGLVLDV